ncbi:MAG: TetR/AcrR family transcriptional regulator [Undibacterium sp.]|uniref:TetR/AcrR family transcriptional regulator n=1 Tax=Undibacterium sp. TaxID=1914977 RepID=UPI002722A91D|nr:TetR/AcrR family transcriptional regulator [Undibacterium sp.]MDO8650927.1 TetR/AcrR family transcriptional regulator [Undibacterium sp.]
MNAVLNEDHRPRVAAQRRERMRQRLVESAMLVFAEKGVGASVIPDVVAAAEVSQGTFYNYFRTNEEILVAVSEELNNELLAMIESEVGSYQDPVKRIACGIRLYLHTAKNYPLFARFACSAGLHAMEPNSLIYKNLPPHIAAGVASGQLSAMPVDVALDLIAGAALAAIFRITTGAPEADYPECVVEAILRGLGVARVQSKKMVEIALPRIRPAPDSLLERGHLRYTTERNRQTSK